MTIETDDELLTADIEAHLAGMGMVPRDAPAAATAPSAEAGAVTADTNASGAAKPADETVTDAGPSRHENGRFAAKTKDDPTPPSAPAAPTAQGQPAAESAPVAGTATPAAEAPKAWTGDARSKWGELPDWAKAEIAKRESDVQKGAAKWDDDRVAGKRVREIFAPHAAEMARDGTTPEKAVQALLASHNMLRSAEPAQRAQLLVKIAKDYGVDLSAAISTGDPERDKLAARNAELEAQTQLGVQDRQQADHASLSDQVEAFFADPAYPRAAELSDDIELFLTGGRAKSLPEAYQLAEKLRPVADASPAPQTAPASPADKAAEARRSAVSVNGAPGSSAPTTTHRSGSYEDAASRAFDDILAR